VEVDGLIARAGLENACNEILHLDHLLTPGAESGLHSTFDRSNPRP
jgi:hypothetical protein